MGLVVQNKPQTLGGITGAIAIIGQVATALAPLVKFLPAGEAISRSGQVAGQLQQIASAITKDTALMQALTHTIQREYSQAPEFFDSWIGDKLSKIGFNPVKIANKIIENRPKCIAYLSKDCANEHLSWINVAYSFIDYINVKTSEMGKVIENLQNKGINFDALPEQEKVSYLYHGVKDKGIQKAGFALDQNTMTIILIGAIILLAMKK